MCYNLFQKAIMQAGASKNTNKTNHIKDLILLFAIPIAIALIAALVIYVPGLLANPKYDFVYTICDDYRCKDNYSVDASGYVIQENAISANLEYYNRLTNIRYYDSSNDSTSSLTLEETRAYKLNTSSKSPDGYALTKESSSSGFLFWGDYDEGWYLKNGLKKKKVELTAGGSFYSRDIKFLGWVNK